MYYPDMKVNKAWHDKHPMPRNPMFEQRVKWDNAHQQRCSCRPIPEKLEEEMERQGINFEGDQTR
jgi:hypothetical protein